MKLFKKRAGKSPRPETRRASRLWKLRLQKLAVVSAVCLALCGGAVALWKSGSIARMKNAVSETTLALGAQAGFRVNEIAVAGLGHVTQDEILSRLGIKQGSPIFAVDLAQAQKNLSELSWVKSASVARRLPNKIEVRIAERAPAALWQYKKKVAVIDADGAVLDVGSLDPYKDLPMVVGADAGRNAAALTALLKAEPAVSSLVSSAARVGQRRWDLHLKNGVVVMLPEKDAELALAKLAKAEEKDKLLDKNIMTVDLRLPDRMVVDMPAQQKTAKKENI